MARRRLWLWSALIALLGMAASALAAEPEVKVNHFHNAPARFFYFEDTSVLVYHDMAEGNVYRSEDEGKSWKRVNDVKDGAAAMLIQHPFDNNMAFILTAGKKHYKTTDRGDSWRSFEVPLEPAWVGNPLAFHANKKEYILYQGRNCDRSGPWGFSCRDDSFYTEDAFVNPVKDLLEDVTSCMFAHSRKEFKHDASENFVYCVGFDRTTKEGGHTLANSRIFSSADFFYKETKVEELGIGKNARGVVALAIVSKYAVAALKDVRPGADGDMMLYVTTDTKNWKQAVFPHGNHARLRENAYTIVGSTTHSLDVDVTLDKHRTIGTLFVSSSDGTQFVESLKDTNRNEAGYVDFESLYGVDGVGIANVVGNVEEVESRRGPKRLQSRITFDDGRSWAPLEPPTKDVDGNGIGCDTKDARKCSLHLHSVSSAHNYGRVFSSPAPGFVMGVGSVGEYLKGYSDCDTFLSTDAGVTWKMVSRNAHMFEFGDQGGIVVMINDEGPVDHIRYSLDFGKTWKKKDLGAKVRVNALTTISDSTSRKFILLAGLSRADATRDGGFGAIFLDFARLRTRQCGSGDEDKWFARTQKGKECMMGHKQWYWRRKEDADCYMGKKFEDPKEYKEDCPCEKDDYECDVGFVRQNGDCVASGPEPVPAGVCKNPKQTYKGSSGYRLIPGNTCNASQGEKLDEKVSKPCSQAAPKEGDIDHHTFKFQSAIVQHQYFNGSSTILVLLKDNTIWQSSSEGYTWTQIPHADKFLAFYMHKYVNDRAYLITRENKIFYTTHTGTDWHPMNMPTPPNSLGITHLHFHPTMEEYIIWIGEEGCNSVGASCAAVAYYSPNNGRKWTPIDKYVRNCEWARDKELKVDNTQILCERYAIKRGDQRLFGRENPLELISGTGYFENQKKLFDHVVGFTKFSEYLVVAEVKPAGTLSLQVSVDGQTFAAGMFPPNMKPETHSYTILESSTDSLFVYMTVQDGPGAYGSILKSNSNGTYFGVSVDNVNRDTAGYVDFEKMIGIDGVGLINVVANTKEAVLSGRKIIQTKITHNDGGTWKFLEAPKVDSNGQKYPCDGKASCNLHIHGYTERLDPTATYSTPSVPGLLMAVGSVGEHLLPYSDSDIFMSRDAGFTWEEVHKDAHLWEFGDSGSVLVAANDEEPTDHVLFTTNEGMQWRTYKFTDEKLRVRKIITVPTDTSRKFLLLCKSSVGMSIAVQIDFSSLTRKKCDIDLMNPGHDDFELWSPSEERQEQCLFGRQTLYHRRKRDSECAVGDQLKLQANIVQNCACKASDFECEYNHYRDSDGKCVLMEGEKPLLDDDSCRDGADFWYERTAYRKIAHSSCEGGDRPDRGTQHACPGFGSHGAAFWWTIFTLPFIITVGVAWWWHRTRGFGGAIRLPGGGHNARYRGSSDSGVLATIASIPWFAIGIAGIAWEWVTSRVRDMSGGRRRGYRNISVDEDAQVLRFQDEE